VSHRGSTLENTVQFIHELFRDRLKNDARTFQANSDTRSWFESKGGAHFRRNYQLTFRAYLCDLIGHVLHIITSKISERLLILNSWLFCLPAPVRSSSALNDTSPAA